MSGRMPILRQDDIAEGVTKPVDDRHDVIALRYGERAVRTEVVLHIDDDQCVAVGDRGSCGQFCLRFVWIVEFAKTQPRRMRASTAAASATRSASTSTG